MDMNERTWMCVPERQAVAWFWLMAMLQQSPKKLTSSETALRNSGDLVDRTLC